MGGAQEGGVITASGGVITASGGVRLPFYDVINWQRRIGRTLQEPGKRRKNAHLHIIKILTTGITCKGHVKSHIGPKTAESWIFRCVDL